MRAVLLLLAMTAATHADWLHFHGDAGQTGISKDKLPDKLETLWTFKCTPDDSFEGAAAIVAGVVLAGSTDEHL